MVERLRAALSVVGALLTGTGVLILLFVAYQLWGTGIYAAQAQDDLRDDFAEQLAELKTTTTTSSPTPVTFPVALPPPLPGDAVAQIKVPKIDLDWMVGEGVTASHLRDGPGHYPSTPLPGEIGNAGIAGHRTTYGAPFNRLDELNPGDEILIRTLRGDFSYRMTSRQIVEPNQVEVLNPTAEPTLTLTTCHPKYSAAKRLIVTAALVPGATEPAPPPPPPPPGSSEAEAKPPTSLADAGLSSERSRATTVLWGVLTALVGATWWYGTRRWRRWPSYLAPALPFLGVLFMFYANLERLLPSNF
ncbi:MAG: class E sortase [Acidimicrobiia bacterium]